jgi:hypothetical protein
MPAPDATLLTPGAQNVSPQTSVILLTQVAEVPTGLQVLAGGVKTTLPRIQSLGAGLTPRGRTNFWRLDAALDPATDYVVQIADAAGTSELTHFSTAATYDKPPGVGPQITGLRLWRVRYPIKKIGAGGCVFSEFEGYIALDFTPGALPGTPPEEVLSVASLVGKYDSRTQTLIFSGIDTVPGGFVGTLSGDGVTLPEGGALSAADALWKPDLHPDIEYCATISISGRNDRAGGTAQSNMLCAHVTSIDAPGVAPAPTSANGDAATFGDAGVANDGASAGAGTGDATGDVGRPRTHDGGCSVAGPRVGADAMVPIATALLILFVPGFTCRGVRSRARQDNPPESI